MSAESNFIEGLRAIATHPGARGLNDDAAVLEVAQGALVLTHDMLIEGVHYLPDDPPETVAWKLVAVNMSDLAAKGARPMGVLLGFTLMGDEAWDRNFTAGLKVALDHFAVPLLGGDTVAMPPDTSGGAPRALGLTAIGSAPSCGAPSRAGAKPGDLIFVSGSIGDAGAGLALLQGEIETIDAWARAALIDAYRRPAPDLALGQALAPMVSAMADISDGLLIDADRMARASGCAICIDLDAVPLSPAYVAARGTAPANHLTAATAGDDYRLLFALAPAKEVALKALAEATGTTLTRVGQCEDGNGLKLRMEGRDMPLPERLGHEHDAAQKSARR